MINWESFQGRESEHNWLIRDKELHVLTENLSSSTPTSSTSPLIIGIKNSLYDLIPLLHTARTQLSLSACRFFQQLGVHCSTPISPPDLLEPCHWEQIISGLFKVCSGTKKIVGQAAQSALVECYAASPPQKIISSIVLMCGDKNFTLRTRSMEALVSHLSRNTASFEYWSLTGGKFAQELESILDKLLIDAIPTVRSSAVDLLILLTLKDKNPKDVMDRVVLRLGTEKWRRLRPVLQSKISKNLVIPLPPPPPSPSTLKGVFKGPKSGSTNQEENISDLPPPPPPSSSSTDDVMFDAIEPDMKYDDDNDGFIEIILPMQKVLLNSEFPSNPKRLDSSPESKIPIRKSKSNYSKSISTDSFQSAISFNSSMELSIGTPLRNYNKCIPLFSH